MKKLFTILFPVVILQSPAGAQVFKTTIGTDAVKEVSLSISQAADSSYVAAGYYTDANFDDFPYLTRIKKDGSIGWMKQVSIPEKSYPFCLVETVKTAASKPDGYIATIDGDDHFYLVRLSNTGGITWAKQITASISLEGKPKPVYDNTGKLTGFYILANFGRTVIKTNTSGNIVWQRKITHPTVGSLYKFADMKVTSDGGVVLVGNTYIEGGSLYSFPVAFRLSSVGTVLFAHSYVLANNGESNPRFYGVTPTPSGYAITASQGWNTNITLSIDNLGASINWAYQFTSTDAQDVIVAGASIAKDASNNLIIAGGEWKVSRNGVMLKLNASGILQFSKKFSSIGVFSDVQVTNTGTYCFSGRGSYGGEADLAVANVSALGNVAASCRSTSVTLGAAPTDKKLVGNPSFGIVADTFTVSAASVRTFDVTTSQVTCASVNVADDATEVQPADKLEVANDMAGQRVAVKWISPSTSAVSCQLVLCNNAGMPLTTVTCISNQTTYIPMNNIQTGMYAVMLRQGAKVIAREKVVWTR